MASIPHDPAPKSAPGRVAVGVEADGGEAVVPGTVSSVFERWARACAAVQGQLRPKAQGALTFPGEQLQLGFERFSALLRDYQQLIEHFNSLPPPGSDRDIRIGEALFPLVLRSLRTGSSTDGEKLFCTLYEHTHFDRAGPVAKVLWPQWMRGLPRHLSVCPLTDQLPPPEVYLERSEALSPRLHGLQSQIAQVQAKYDELHRKNEAARRHSGNNAYAEGLAKLERELDGLKKLIPDLCDQLNDAPPEEIPEVVNSLKVRVSGSSEFMLKVLEFGRNLQQFLAVALTQGAKQKALELRIPVLDAEGKVILDKFSFSQGAIQGVRTYPALLEQAIDLYVGIRGFVRAALPTMEPFRALSGISADAGQFLGRPFVKQGASGEKALDVLTESPEEPLRKATCRLLADPIAEDGPGKKDGHSLEVMPNIRPLSWVVLNCLASTSARTDNPFWALLSAAPALARTVLPLLAKAKELYAAKDFQKLAQLFNQALQEAPLAKEPFAMLAPTIVLGAVLNNQQARERLRNQIPNVDSLNDIPSAIERTHPQLVPSAQELVRLCQKSLAFSMIDFYRDLDLEELWKFVERFKLYLRHPECLDGIPGNEGMRSGILIEGPFGAGKTFFVECLANELDLKLFKISPDEGEVSSSKRMIDGCRSVIGAAKKHIKDGNGCILFIDEAELVMADRENPRITQDQMELTCYLLQEINEIRLKYPRILLVAATNFLDRIDGGMFRDGRFDIQLSMGPPSRAMRKNLISGTLASENIPAVLEEAKLDYLADVTEGLMALPIKRTIRELNRFGRLAAVMAGQSFEVNFDSLLEALKEEQARARKRFSKKRNGEPRVDSPPPESAQTATPQIH